MILPTPWWEKYAFTRIFASVVTSFWPPLRMKIQIMIMFKLSIINKSWNIQCQYAAAVVVSTYLQNDNSSVSYILRKSCRFLIFHFYSVSGLIVGLIAQFIWKMKPLWWTLFGKNILEGKNIISYKNDHVRKFPYLVGGWFKGPFSRFKKYAVKMHENA